MGLMEKIFKSLKRSPEGPLCGTFYMDGEKTKEKKVVTEFFDRPPPFVGWWLTTDTDMPYPLEKGVYKRAYWRWWNGSAWSVSVYSDDTSIFVEYCSGITNSFGEFAWSWYWPENPRVPRINPYATSSESEFNHE